MTNPAPPKRILVVDDEKHMLRLVQFNLSKLGCRIDTAQSGEEALEAVKTSPAVDLIIVDFSMPGMNGFETIQAIQALPDYANLPVIMLTARGHVEKAQEFETLNISSTLTKPFSPIELTNQARQLLNL